MICCAALLAGCEHLRGDFCDVAKPDVYATSTVAAYMVKNDPEHVRRDVAENEYGVKHCGWVKSPEQGS